MNKKQEKSPKAKQLKAEQAEGATHPQPTTLMAVQEKLGLFAPEASEETQETHQILNKKPLGYI
jgi:hypothetical protein